MKQMHLPTLPISRYISTNFLRLQFSSIVSAAAGGGDGGDGGSDGDIAKVISPLYLPTVIHAPGCNMQ